MFFRSARNAAGYKTAELVKSFSRIQSAIEAAETIAISGQTIKAGSLLSAEELAAKAPKGSTLRGALDALGLNRSSPLVSSSKLLQTRGISTSATLIHRNLPQLITPKQRLTLSEADMIRIRLELQASTNGEDTGSPISIEMMTAPLSDINIDDFKDTFGDYLHGKADEEGIAFDSKTSKQPKSIHHESGGIQLDNLVIGRNFTLLSTADGNYIAVPLDDIIAFCKRRMVEAYRTKNYELVSDKSKQEDYEKIATQLVESFAGLPYAGPSGGPGETFGLFQQNKAGLIIAGDMTDMFKSEYALSKSGSRLSGVNASSPIHDQRLHVESIAGLTADGQIHAASHTLVGHTELLSPDGKISNINGSEPTQIVYKGDVTLADGRRRLFVGTAATAVADVASAWLYHAATKTCLSTILSPIVSSKDEDPVDCISPFFKKLLTACTPKPWVANRQMYMLDKEGQFETFVFSGRASKWPHNQQLLKIQPTDGSDPLWVNATGICYAGIHSGKERGSDVTNALSDSTENNKISFAVDLKTRSVRPATAEELEELQRGFSSGLECIHGEQMQGSEPAVQLVSNWRTDSFHMVLSDGSAETMVQSSKPYLDTAVGCGNTPFEACQDALSSLTPVSRFVMAAKQLDSQLMKLVAKNDRTQTLASRPIMQAIYRGEPTRLSDKEAMLVELLVKINPERHAEITSNFDYSVEIINQAGAELKELPASLVSDFHSDKRLK